MRFNNIQILRFFAAAGVLLYHAHGYIGEHIWKTWLTRLFDYHFSWGVELFFVISGFVVSHSLSRQSPGRFLANRLVRVYPALWLASAIVLVWRFIAIDARPDPVNVLLAFSLFPTPRAEFQLGDLEWTLVYEVFFYLLLACIGLLRVRNAREWAMVVWAGAIGATALFTSLEATALRPTAATIFLSAFNLPFIAGVLAYSWFTRERRLPVTSLLLLVPVALYAAHRVHSTVAQLAFQAVGFGALVLLAAQRSRSHDPAPSHPLVKLGDWSYGIYLVHLSVIRGVTTLFAARPDLANICFVVDVAVALLAGIVYGVVETTMYRHAKQALRGMWRVRPAVA